MPRRKGPVERLERQKQHRTVLNRLLKDIRLSPNRALLAEMLAIYFDVVKPEDQEMLKSLLIGSFGNAKLIRWYDNEDPPSEEKFLSRRDAAATEKIRDVFSEILRSGEVGADAVHAQNI